MRKLVWHVASGAELSQLLKLATLEESAAVGGATLYRLSQDGEERIAIALPDGQAMVIEPGDVNKPRRRRLELTTGEPDQAAEELHRPG